MSRSSPSTPRQVLGVGIFFSSNGIGFTALLPWYPILVQRLDLSPWEFGFVVAAFALGSIISSVLPARLIARFSAIPVVVGGTVLLALSVALAAWSTSGWMLAAFVFLAGFFDAIVDVAQNVVGIMVQENAKKTVLSSMHALWSLGALLSGGVATFAASSGIDVRWHLGIVSAVVVGLVVIGALLVSGFHGQTAGSEPPRGGGRSRLSRGLLLAALPLAVVAICGATVEDIVNNWSGLAAVQLSHVPAESAGIAFSVAIGSQCIGRFSGDFLVQRFGPSLIAKVGGICITLGGLALATAVEPIQLMVGLAAMGYGCATLIPGALGAAAHISDSGRAAGVTLVNWMMRLGFLGTSPLVGLVTTATDLRWGLSLVVLIGIVTVVFSKYLAPRVSGE